MFQEVKGRPTLHRSHSIILREVIKSVHTCEDLTGGHIETTTILNDTCLVTQITPRTAIQEVEVVEAEEATWTLVAEASVAAGMASSTDTV